MPEHICEVCKKTYYSKDKVRRFCSKECRGKANSMGIVSQRRSGEGRHKKSKDIKEAQAKARASDSQSNIKCSQPLVPPNQCKKCEYGAGGDSAGYYCGYLFKTGQTRTAQHPEGLTSTCYEFKPKRRKRKKAYDDN